MEDHHLSPSDDERPLFLNGGGVMGALIRAHDWARTPVGPLERWPQSLRTTVRLALNTNHPVFIFWGDDQICLYNDAYMATLGPERHPGALGQRAADVWAEVWDIIGPQIDLVMSGQGATWNIGQKIPLTRHGRVEDTWWTYSYSPIDDEDSPNGIGGVLVLTSDVSEQHRLAAELDAEKQRLRSLFNQTPGFITLLKGPEHTVELANQSYRRLIGHRDILGKPLREGIPELEGQGYFEMLDKVYASGEPFQGKRLAVSVPSGPGQSMETRFLDFVYQPIIGDDASVTGIFVEGHDVTDQKESEGLLRNALDANRAILSNISEGVFGIDINGRIIFENPAACRILGYAPDELSGKSGHTMIHHHHPDGTPYPPEKCPIYLTMQDRRTRAVEGEVFFGKDGAPIPVEYTVSAVNDPGNGSGLGFVVSFRDVSEQKRNADLRSLETEVLEAVSTGRPLNEILHGIAVAMDRLLPHTSTSIALVQDGCLYHVAAPGLPDDYISSIDGLEIAEGAGSCGTAAARGGQVIVRDISTDPLWSRYASLGRAHGLASCWSTPVIDADGQVLATFALYSTRTRAPGEMELAVIARVGTFVRLAIERTRQTETLRRSEAHYRSIYDLVPVLIWEEDWSAVKSMLLTLKRDGVVDFADHFDQHPEFLRTAIRKVHVHNVNKTGALLFGAKTSQDLITSKDDIIAKPASMTLFKRAVLAYLSGERQFESESDTTDLNGERLHLYVKMLIPDIDAPETGVVLTQMDITALRAADERFGVVVKATSDVVWDHDPVSGKVWCSDGLKERFGLDPADFISGKTVWSDHLHPDERDEVIANQARVLAGDAATWKTAYRFRRKDGSYAHIEDRGTVIRDSLGKAIRMIGSMVDVTHQKQIEEQLRQSQRLDAVGQLTGGVAHDFNNLLTVILGNAEVLVEHLSDRPMAKRMAEMTASAAERGAELTSRLLAFARKQPLQPKLTDVNQLLSGMDGLLRRTLTATISIQLAPARHLWVTELDPGQLEVAILNLAINARDAMPMGGCLTVETANAQLDDAYAARHDEVKPGDYVMIAVSDTGVGMTPDVAARAFEPFFTTKDVGKGSGLGLSLVYGFARQSGGHAVIYSEFGHGTTIRLYFPRSGKSPRPVVEGPGDAMIPGGNERILVVEDDPMVREHLIAQLQSLGYSVTNADSGMAAMRILHGDEAFDLLFTDVVMPGGMNGRQLADAARTARPGLKILFTSGYSDSAIIHHGRLDRDVQLLSKPYRRQELAMKVRAMLDT